MAVLAPGPTVQWPLVPASVVLHMCTHQCASRAPCPPTCFTTTQAGDGGPRGPGRGARAGPRVVRCSRGTSVPPPAAARAPAFCPACAACRPHPSHDTRPARPRTLRACDATRGGSHGRSLSAPSTSPCACSWSCTRCASATTCWTRGGSRCARGWRFTDVGACVQRRKGGSARGESMPGVRLSLYGMWAVWV